ncbi:membrane protein [Desulfuromonas versatilis]|uniref:Membrane protein n=1 Tax=Desulfuromonas versatilis TaxID=2802975 RepID=A0ABM8HSD9_9BACT|nr:Slp family lipoprotein [Desulfuromonas versatilis]BCR04813.1 membrane protein [Desulfuromonas versatilis]
MKPVLLLALLAGTLALAGCSHVISREQRAAAGSQPSFAELRQNPASHQGRTLLLGGLILANRADDGAGTLELLRFSLDPWGEPVAVDETGSRFLVRSAGPFDPARFEPGRLLTLTATLDGEELYQGGYVDYRYPVFSPGEIYLWETPFRLGVKPHANLYAPYYQAPEPEERGNRYAPAYAPYPYTPTWIRPAGAR